MHYSEMLSEIIGESGLSLRQISRHCLEQEISITPSYISQLKNGKLPPPSEAISLTLAKVCGYKNSSQLVFQGYMEKAPSLVREYMLASSYLNKLMLESLCKSSTEFTPEFKKYIEELDVLSTLDLSSKYISEKDENKGNELIREISFAKGLAVKLESASDLLHVFLPDSSMSPLIPIHSYVYILHTKVELIKDRDIIAFYPNSSRLITLRKYFKVNDKIILMPEDKTHQVYIFNNLHEVNYAGKVVSYKVDL